MGKRSTRGSPNPFQNEVSAWGAAIRGAPWTRLALQNCHPHIGKALRNRGRASGIAETLKTVTAGPTTLDRVQRGDLQALSGRVLARQEASGGLLLLNRYRISRLTKKSSRVFENSADFKAKSSPQVSERSVSQKMLRSRRPVPPPSILHVGERLLARSVWRFRVVGPAVTVLSIFCDTERFWRLLALPICIFGLARL